MSHMAHQPSEPRTKLEAGDKDLVSQNRCKSDDRDGKSMAMENSHADQDACEQDKLYRYAHGRVACHDRRDGRR